MNPTIVQQLPVSKVGTKMLIPFLLITFGLTWGLATILILFADQVTTPFGDIGLSNPLIILAVYSPGIAGVLLVWWYYGLKGWGSFFRRIPLWHAPLPWWLFLIFGTPAIVFTCAFFKGTINTAFPFSPGTWHYLPWGNLTYIVVAIIVVWLNRRTMFSHDQKVVEILLHKES